MKKCRFCQVNLEVGSNWYLCNQRKHYNCCTPCERSRRKPYYSEWYKNFGANKYYIKRYGVSLQQKREMYQKQKGQCALCGTKMLSSLDCVIDHNHTTRKVRSLIHRNCNSLLGLAQDKISLLEMAILYLQQHS